MHPLNNRNFRLFISTRFLLTSALQMQAVIVGWEIYRLTKDVFSLGLIGLAEAIPAISIALFAGHIADRHNRKIILAAAIFVMLLSACGLLYFTSAKSLQELGAQTTVKFIYLFIIISGFARGFYSPTSSAILPEIVSKQLAVKGTTFYSTAWQMAAIAGPAFAGFLYAATNITLCFWAIVILAFAALLSMLRIRYSHTRFEHKHHSVYQSLREGVSYVFHHKIILSALSLDLFSVLFGGAVALLPVFANDMLQVGPQGLGFLRAAPSFGASITMIALSFFKTIKQPGKVLIACVGAFGLCMIGFGLSENYYLSLVLLFASGAFDSVSVVIRGTIMQLFVPDNMRGRVSAVNTIFIGSSNEIGAFESGLAAKLLGVVPSVVFGGCATTLIVLFTHFNGKEMKAMKFESS